MGGVDQLNVTGQILHALKTCALPADCRITAVAGLTAPWWQNIRELSAQMPGLATLMVVLADNQRDIAIGLERAGAAITLDQHCISKFVVELKNAMTKLISNEIFFSTLVVPS